VSAEWNGLNRRHNLSGCGSRSRRGNNRDFSSGLNNGSSISDRSNSIRGRGSSRFINRLCVGLVGRAFPRDVASLRALVADLARRAQWATIGGGAVTGDVALEEV
jgi:hypothetical protein